MKKLRTALRSSLVIAGCVLAGVTAYAQVIDYATPTFVLTPDTLTGYAGDTTPSDGVLFTATITNNDPRVALYLNDLNVVPSSGQLVADSAPFTGTYNDSSPYGGTLVPLYLDPSDESNPTYSGPLFYINVLPGTTPGDYGGTVTLQGGIDDGASDTLGTADFTVVVSAPEGGASSIYLLLAGGVCFGALALRTRKARKAGQSA